MSQPEPENAPQLAATRVGDDESKAAFPARTETVDDAAGERDGRDGQDGRDASPSPPSSSCVDASLLAEELSASTLAALQDFLSAQAAAAQHQHALSAQAAETGSAEGGSAGGDEAGGTARDGEGAGTTGGQEVAEDALFAEDWGLSQFWYDAHTSATVAAEVARLMGGDAACARADEERKGEEAEEKPREEADGESAGGGKGVERKEARGNGEGEGESSVGSGGPRCCCVACPTLFRELVVSCATVAAVATAPPPAPHHCTVHLIILAFPFASPHKQQPLQHLLFYPCLTPVIHLLTAALHCFLFSSPFPFPTPTFTQQYHHPCASRLTHLSLPSPFTWPSPPIPLPPLSHSLLPLPPLSHSLLPPCGPRSSTPLCSSPDALQAEAGSKATQKPSPPSFCSPFAPSPPHTPPPCTSPGAVQAEAAKRLLQLRPAVFRPEHRNKLGNDFRLFTSYPPPQSLGGWEPDS
ncbi:unnamed protein product [Closterium sp. NIES-54]